MASVEEVDHDDEHVNRALRWRVIQSHLAGVDTILDIGGGTGAFSISLAKQGYRVTHVDVSRAMLERADANAKREGITLELVEASGEDLARFPDRSFDLVLNMDGAISFSGDRAGKVLAESCRVTGTTLIATASNKACMVPTWIKYSIRAAHRILPAVQAMMRTGYWHKDQFPENALMYPDFCDIETFQAFTVPELVHIIECNDMRVVTARALGSLTHLLLPHGELAIPNDELVELCELYDVNVMPMGPGSFRRAGLLVVATPARS